MKTYLAILGVLLSSAPAFAQGIVIPDEPEVPPLAIERHAVRVEIDRQTAVTTIEQIFANNTDRRLEAKYIFPIPKGAALSRFTMLVNGKETAGEMVEKDKALQIYQAIVRRAQDPGLIEYLGSDVFRASIFPIEPRSKQTITLRFAQALPAEQGLVSYTYPVRAGTKRGPTVTGESSIEVTITESQPIVNVYSPSHSVNVERKSDREARVTWSQKNTTLHRDFQLYYGFGAKDVGMNLVTYRPDPTEPGYFMLLLSPRPTLQVDRIVERDIVFVVDTSGSMAGEKIEQARNALKHCVRNLNDGDRFNIVRFSSDVYPWKDELVPAKEMRDAAIAWIDKMQAAGGTDILGGIKEGLKYPKDPARPYVVVFMTDGKPTLGETTQPREIIQRVAKLRGESVRIFTWGVGYDLDVQLIDGIAEVSRGVSEYVRPEEDIAVKVSTFWGKASKPVLADLEIQVDGEAVRLVDLQPSPLPDLYAGGQVVLFGRYTGEGHIAVRLSGKINGQAESFTYEGTFAKTELKSSYLEILWARRKIGYLLDAIRLHGESKELVDEVVALAKKYGIQTPYTSWLILEDGSTAPTSAREREDRKKMDDKLGRFGTGGGSADPGTRAEQKAQADEAESVTKGFKEKDGKNAVDAAKYVQGLKQSENAGKDVSGIRKAFGTRFILFRGMWVDERFESEMTLTVVKFGSAAYFKILEKHPKLVEAFKLGTEVLIVTAKGKALVIAAKGDEEIADEKLKALFD